MGTTGRNEVQKGMETAIENESKRGSAEEAEKARLLKDIQFLNNTHEILANSITDAVMGVQKKDCFSCKKSMTRIGEMFMCRKCDNSMECTQKLCRGRLIPQTDAFDEAELFICTICHYSLEPNDSSIISKSKKILGGAIKKDPLIDNMITKPVQNRIMKEKVTTTPAKKATVSKTTKKAPPVKTTLPTVPKSAPKRKTLEPVVKSNIVEEIDDEEEDQLVNQKKQKVLASEYLHDDNPNYIPDSRRLRILETIEPHEIFKLFYSYHVMAVLNTGWEEKSAASLKDAIFKQNIAYTEIGFFLKAIGEIPVRKLGEDFPRLWALLQEIGGDIISVDFKPIETSTTPVLKQADKPSCRITDAKSKKGFVLMEVVIKSMIDGKEEENVYLLREDWANFFSVWRQILNYNEIVSGAISDKLMTIPAEFTMVKKAQILLGEVELINVVFTKLCNIYKYFFGMITPENGLVDFNRRVQGPILELFSNMTNDAQV